MASIRYNLEHSALSFVDLCTWLTGRSSTKLQNRLSVQAEKYALTHISQALRRAGVSFSRPGAQRRQISPGITSAQELVHILHEFRLHNSLTSAKGGKQVRASALDHGIEDFLAKFSIHFPGLWLGCDLERLFTEATPCTTADATCDAMHASHAEATVESPNVDVSASSPSYCYMPLS